MNNLRIDWRWVGIIGAVIIMAAGSQIPWPLRFATLAAVGGYLLWIGWQRWMSASGLTRRANITYWRGQRIELKPQRQTNLPLLSDIGPALLPLLLGIVLILASIALLLRALGI